MATPPQHQSPQSFLSNLNSEIQADVNRLEELTHIYNWRNTSDADQAIYMLQEELTSRIEFLKNLRRAHGIYTAVDLDGQPVANQTRMEIQAESDRNLAEAKTEQDVNMDDVDVPVARPGKIKINIHRLPRALSKLAPASFKCIICYEDYQPSKLVRLPCKDLYCTTCLKNLFLLSINDQSLFPPKCHGQVIPIFLISGKMTPQQLDSFSNAEMEFSTVDRTYCSNTECNRFIHPRQITSDRAGCTHCGSVTCTICKKPAHQDDCPADHDLQATLALALNEKWQRCFSCSAIVELDTGCNHMTCNCGAQFCYLCGEKWKKCSCEGEE